MNLCEENNGGELVKKTRQATLKLALAFALKLQKKMETMDKEVMYSFYSGQSVGWKNIIQDLSNSLHQEFLASLTSKMELGQTSQCKTQELIKKINYFILSLGMGFDYSKTPY